MSFSLVKWLVEIRVILSNENGYWEALTKGISQGSGLKPIIVNIFTNEAFIFYKNVIMLIMQIIILLQR